MKKLAGLDYIRAISAILIVLYHYTTRYFEIYFDASYGADHIGLWWGCWAVSVFFILSGFLTVYNLSSNTTFSRFLKKRFIRIYPGYFFSVIITTFFTLIFASNQFIGLFPTLMNFTVIQSFFGIKSVDGAYWTLVCEIVFYAIVAFMILIRQEKNHDVFCTLWLSAIIVNIVANNFFSVPPIINSLFSVFAIEKYAHTFIIGISLYYILESNKRSFISYMNLIAGVTIHFCRFGTMAGIFILICTLLIVASVKTRFSFKNDKVLVFLARISFPLYLLHQNIGYIVMQYASRLGMHNTTGLVTAIVFSLVLATVVQNYLINPVGKFLKTRMERIL